METESVQDLVEQALENAIDTLNLLTSDKRLDARLVEAQRLCNNALVELRGYGHSAPREEWQEG